MSIFLCTRFSNYSLFFFPFPFLYHILIIIFSSIIIRNFHVSFPLLIISNSIINFFSSYLFCIVFFREFHISLYELYLTQLLISFPHIHFFSSYINFFSSFIHFLSSIVHFFSSSFFSFCTVLFHLSQKLPADGLYASPLRRKT